MNPQLASLFNVPAGKGALIINVAPDSPAARAGLHEGDVLTEVDGKPVGNSRELRMLITQSPPAPCLNLKVHRGGGPKTLTATLAELPNAQPAPNQPKRT